MSDQIKTRSLADLARVVLADLQGMATDPAERAEVLTLTGFNERYVREVVDRNLAQQRHAQTMAELAKLQAGLEALGALVIVMSQRLEQITGGE